MARDAHLASREKAAVARDAVLNRVNAARDAADIGAGADFTPTDQLPRRKFSRQIAAAPPPGKGSNRPVPLGLENQHLHA